MPPTIDQNTLPSFATENGNNQIHKEKKNGSITKKTTVTITGANISHKDTVVITSHSGKIWAGTVKQGASTTVFVCDDLDLIRGDTVGGGRPQAGTTEDLSTTVTNSNSETSNVVTTNTVTTIP